MKRAKQRSQIKQFWIHVGGQAGFEAILLKVFKRELLRAAFRGKLAK